jgi:hypothetical protein
MKTIHLLLKCKWASALSVVMLVACSSAYAGVPEPYSNLYMVAYNGTGGCGNIIAEVQNSRVLKTFVPVGGDCNIADALSVYDKIRTIGVRPGYTGAEYSLFGVPTGRTFPYPHFVDNYSAGTTDGIYNYSGGYFDGVVYQFCMDWQNPTALFSTGLYLGGITYDPSNDTLWVADSRDLSGGVVNNYTKQGTLLSSFNVAVEPSQQVMGLALDPATQTLWLSRLNTSDAFNSIPVLEEYSKTGKLLGSLSLNALKGYIVSGMQFRVPHRF